MEDNTLLINKKIGQNIALFRKREGWTQAELAEKISYSDKSVSKWESGSGAPDIYVLVQLAQLFGVTVNDLLMAEQPKSMKRKPNLGLHLMIMALSSGIVWLVATCFFVLFGAIPETRSGAWMSFIFALAANSIVLLVLVSVWRYKRLNFIFVSLTVWTSILAVFCAVKYIACWQGAAWMLFLLGIPLQVLAVLWAFFRFKLRKARRK